MLSDTHTLTNTHTHMCRSLMIHCRSAAVGYHYSMNNVIVTVKFTLSDKEYEGKLSSQAMLQCTVFANINEKDQHWVGKTTQQFALPQISFSFPGGSSNAKKGKYN